ncbi:MAG: type II toxin-antitoxin system Phd/YefM family antitoxin [Caldilineaceae bacterium]
MLNVVPQIEPVTRLARDHTAIFALLRNGPVILAQHSKPTAVLVDVDTWNDAVRRLAYLERLAAGDRALQRIRSGEFATVEEVDAGFAALGFPTAEE